MLVIGTNQKYNGFWVSIRNFVAPTMCNFILLLVLVFFPPLSSSHCCHKCVWQDVIIREGMGSPYPDRTRGCSIGCNGDVLDDGTCKPGGPQVFC